MLTTIRETVPRVARRQVCSVDKPVVYGVGGASRNQMKYTNAVPKQQAVKRCG